MTASTDAKSKQPDRVYRRLRRMILDNTLTPGDVVLQEELATQLGVSRTPVREALVRLERDGLIEVRPRRGVRVRPVSIREMREIYDVLAALEAQAARTAAERGAGKVAMRKLEHAVAGMDCALACGDLDAWSAADAVFHQSLINASRNSRLIAMANTMTDQAHRVRRLTLKLRELPVRSNDDHRAVVAAIKAGDGDTAFARHYAHRSDSGAMLVALLERIDITSA